MGLKHINCPQCGKVATIYNAKIECVHCRYGIGVQTPQAPQAQPTIIVQNVANATSGVYEDRSSHGRTGFWLSLIGILLCGILCPLGVIMSTIGLFCDESKGYAVAGFIIGLLGTIPFAVIIVPLLL